MRFELVMNDKKYRGIGRGLLISDVINKKNRKEFEYMLELYLSFLEDNEINNEKSLVRTIEFYKVLISFDIPCEIILYNQSPVTQAWGYTLEFLGIDITHDLCESLIDDEINPKIEHLLNENGLCKTEEDVKTIIPYQDCGDVEWSPCYVYKMILE